MFTKVKNIIPFSAFESSILGNIEVVCYLIDLTGFTMLVRKGTTNEYIIAVGILGV